MIAVVDETNPEVGGGLLYSVVAGVIIDEEPDARIELAKVIPERKRPFHWWKGSARCHDYLPINHRRGG